MIFKDAKASKDIENIPAARGYEPCLNCGQSWDYHGGWACKTDHRAPYSKIPNNQKYITKSMLDSIGLTLEQYQKPSTSAVTSAPMGEVPQWKASLSLSMRTGECPCGVNRQVCHYHNK